MSKNPVLKPFATSLETPSSLIGFVASASTIPGMLISLPAASLSDIFGRRKILLVSTFIFASAPFLYLLITEWWQLIIVRFYHGFATAIFVPVAEATIVERFPAKRGERISLFNSATAIGRGIAPFLGGYILFSTSYSYNTLYLTVGVAGTTALLTTVLFLVERKSTAFQTEDSNRTAHKMFQGLYNLAKNRGVLGISIIQGSQYYVYGAAEFFLVGYLNEVVKLDPLSIGTITGIQIVTLIISRPFMGRVSDKIGRRIPIILGSVISSLLILLFPFTIQFPILVLLSIGYGLGFAMVISSTAPMLSELVPANLVGTSMGFLSSMMDVGQTLGPIISGVILASLQYVGLFSSFSFLMLLSSSIFIIPGFIKSQKSNNK